MKMIATCILAATVLLAQSAMGQTNASALQTALRGKPLALRTYSTDPVVKYTWVEGKLVPDTISLHGLDAFFTDTVKQKGSSILIDGHVETLVRDAGKIAPMGKMPMQIEVDLQSGKPDTVIPQLKALLFFPSLKDALDNLPPYVSDFIPYPVDGKFQVTCNCTHIFQNGKWTSVTAKDGTLVPPVIVTKAPDTGLNQMAINEKMSGTITLISRVGDNGRVDEVWVAKPLGADLDQSAGKAAWDTVFRPATFNGQPVGTVLIQTIPVNYLATAAPAASAPAAPSK